jgi:hypothetical protein
MTTNSDFDRRAAAFLADGPTELADRVLDAALREVHTTKQRRRLPTPRRFLPMPTYLRLAAGIAVVAIGGFALFAYLNPRLGPAGPAAPTPQPSPRATAAPTATTGASPTVAPIDTSAWTIYASGRNWLSVAHPSDWTEEPADHAWTLPADGAWPNTGADKFQSPDGTIAAAAWSVLVPPGTTLEGWIADYCPLNTSPCTGIAARAVPITTRADQRAGLLVPFEGDVQAFFLDSDRIYVVAIWRGDADPNLAQYGGGRRLLEAFASTLCMTCASPAGSTPRPN